MTDLLNTGLVSLSGVVLGALLSRRFLVLPAAAFRFLFFSTRHKGGADHSRCSAGWASGRGAKSTKRSTH
jgi:hypothetical protein